MLFNFKEVTLTEPLRSNIILFTPPYAEAYYGRELGSFYLQLDEVLRAKKALGGTRECPGKASGHKII